MENKEERILIDIIEPGLNCVYRMDNDPKGLSLCKHNGEEEPVSEKDCNNCLEGMTRQEAIEVMAKAIYVFFVENSIAIGLAADWEDLKQPLVKKFYIETAEAALNALLEGVEK